MTTAAPSLLVPALALLAGCSGTAARYVPGPERSADLPADVEALVGLADEVAAEVAEEGLRDPARVDRGLAALEKALAVPPPAPFDVLWRLARADHDMADLLPHPDQRYAYAKEGAERARRAIAVEPSRVEGHYYLALNLARQAQATSDASLLEPMLKVAKKAAEIDPGFQGGAPLRLLGKVYMNAPEWPASVGDRDEAVRVLEEAVRLDPSPWNRLFLGEALFHQEEPEKAIPVLRRALEDGRKEGLSPRWIDEGEGYLRQMGEKP